MTDRAGMYGPRPVPRRADPAPVPRRADPVPAPRRADPAPVPRRHGRRSAPFGRSMLRPYLRDCGGCATIGTDFSRPV